MAKNFLPSPIENALANAPGFGLPESMLQQPQPRQQASYSGGVPYMNEFSTSAQRYGVPINILMALAEQESSFNPTALGQPTKYGRAKGIMQYIDSTAAAMGINPYDPAQAIDAAARQLSERLAKGYSMQEAVNAHFAGDDRKQWGPKTAAYGVEVLGRADKFMNGGNPTVARSSGQQAADGGMGLNYPPAQSAMENMQQTELRTQAIRRQALLDELNKEEPDRYRPLSATELAQLQQQQQPGQEQKPVEFNTDPTPLQKPQAELRSWEPSLWDQFLGLFPGNKDAATVEMIARDIAKRDGVSVEEVYKSVGGARPIFNPEGRPPLRALAEGASVVGEQIPNVPAATANAVLRAVRGGDVPATDEGFIDRAITATDIPKKEFTDPNYDSLQGIDQSLGFTVANLLPSIAAGAAGNTVSPGVGTAAGMATSGGIAYRSAKDSFMGQIREKAEREKGSPLTNEEWAKIRDESESAAVKYGAWEAIPEALSNAIALRMISTPLTGGSRLAKLGDAGKRVGKEQLSEQATETITGVGQNRAELEVGLTNREMSPGDVLREQALQTAIVTGISGGGAQMGRAIYDRVKGTGKQQPAAEAQEQPAADPAVAEPVVNEPAVAAPAGVEPVTDTGPIERAVSSEEGRQPAGVTGAEAVPVSSPSAENEWLGSPGTVTQISPVEDPQTSYTVTVEGYRDGEVFARTEDGTPFQFGPSDIVQPQQAVAEMPAAVPSENTASNEGEKTEVAEPRQPKALEDMTEAELRDRMRYLAQQAKVSGWDKRLTAARKEVERAINAKVAQQEGQNDQQSGADVSTQREGDIATGVPSSQEGAQTDQRGSDGVATGVDPSVGAGGVADNANATSGALVGNDGKPRWFGTAEKAQAFIGKRKLQSTHVVTQVGNGRFEIHATEQTAAATAATPDNVSGTDVGQTPKPAPTTTKSTPFINRAKKLVGDVGEVFSPSGDVGVLSADSSYRITAIDKNGTMHVENTDTGAGGSITRAELYGATSRKVRFNKVAPSVAKTTTIEPEQTRADVMREMEQDDNADSLQRLNDAVQAGAISPSDAQTITDRAMAAAKKGRDRSIAGDYIDEAVQRLTDRVIFPGNASTIEMSETGRRVRIDKAGPLDVAALGKQEQQNQQQDTPVSIPSQVDGVSSPNARPWDVTAEGRVTPAYRVGDQITAPDGRTGEVTEIRGVEKNGQPALELTVKGDGKAFKVLQSDLTQPETKQPKVASKPAKNEEKRPQNEKSAPNLNNRATSREVGSPKKPEADVRIEGIDNLTRAVADVLRGKPLKTRSNNGNTEVRFDSNGEPFYVHPGSLSDARQVINALTGALSQEMRTAGVTFPSNPADMTRDQFVMAYELNNAIPEFELDQSQMQAVLRADRNGAFSVDKDALYDEIQRERQAGEAITGEAETVVERPALSAPTAKEKAYGADNKLVSRDRADELRKQLKAKFSQLNSGIDPEIMSIGTQLAVFHIEAGVRKFADFARTMATDLEQPMSKIRPYLRSWYNGARDMMEDSNVSINGMDDAATVRAELSKLETETTTQPEAAPGLFDNMVQSFDSEVRPNESEQLGEPGARALEGVSTNPVRATEGERDVGSRSEAGSGTDVRGNERARSAGDDRARSVGNDAGDVPVSAGRGGDGRRAERVRGENAGSNEADQRVPSGRRDRVTPTEGTVAQDRPADLFTIDPDTIGKGGKKSKFRDNVAAIRLLKDLEIGNRQATAAEQAVLAKYVGWGGIPEAFAREDGSTSSGWAKDVAELKDILLPEELSAAAASTRNAHYTSPEIITGMWDAMKRMGFTGGRTLEPSVGVGNFYGMMPADLRAASKLHGVELDRITGGIAAQLYPEAKISRMGFQDYTIPDGYFDAVVGNPPFGSEKLYDAKRKDLSKFSIHNYFFARSVDALRPGGVMAMVVTNRFMDGSGNKSAREYIHKKADLLGAIRLPNNAFAKNAGTEVTTDIVFLRRREDGTPAAGASWLNVADYRDTNGKTVPLNEYFKANPDMMLGDFGAHGSMYRGDDAALVAREGQDTAAELARAIQTLPENVMAAPEIASVQPESRQTVQADVNRVGSMFINSDGKIMQRGEDVMGERTGEAVTFPSKKAEERVTGMLRIRDALTRLRTLQLSSNATDATLAEARERLNKVYDRFVAANGPINQDANKRLFRDDPTWPQISALEDDFDRGLSAAVAKKTGEEARAPSAKKAAIFSKRTQSPYSAPTSAGTAKDALVASLSERGRVDMGLMQQLYGKTEQQIADELGDLLFDAPGSGWQTREEYLSGNVKKKLQEAENAAANDARYARNVDALKAIQPADIEAVDIRVKPGAAWIPANVMAEFANHITESTNAKPFYNRLTAKWSYPGLDASSAAKARFGTDRMSVANILEAAAAQKAVQVYDNHPDNTRTLNETETQLANDKVALVRQEWDQWLWSDDARRTSLARMYNDQFNTDVPREYDGSHLNFPGKVSDDIITLRPHQKNAVWRIIQGDPTLLDHVVGAGKSFTFIAAIMELRRLGLAKKPLVPVPNHLVGQIAADFVKLYPGANVLAASKKDFEKANRKRLFSRIATGDWDAVIVGHSSFGKVQMDPHLESDFIKEEIADITSSIAEIEAAEGKRTRNVKQAQDRKTRLEEKLKKLIDSGRKDDSLYWSELGVDALAVDEFHEFKNLAFNTGMRNVAGLGNPTGSQKAMDMYMKIRHLMSMTGGRNLITATGTPISNTMAEMYTMQRYMDYDALKQQGMSHFDAWARMYGEVVTDWELSPSGQYKMNSRFAKFVNMPEMMQRYTSFADVINRDDINRMLASQGKRLPVPKLAGGKPANIVVDRSKDQAAYIGEPIVDHDGVETGEFPQGSLVWRAENLPKRPEKGADNMLKIMSDARKAALDMRLIDPSYPDNPNSKVNHAAGRIKVLYDQWNADRGTQLVFIDLSTPKGAKAGETARIRELVNQSQSENAEIADAAQAQLDKMSPDELLALDSDFSVYDDLKQKLIDRGIPAEEIAFIHDANTEAQKEELFGKVRTGRVRVLFGSTSKMGAGMNVQNRLVALHHLDVPWRPSDLEQREGRIIRQGNELYERDPDNFEVHINRYAAKQTLDSRMWQTIESKARFIEQVRKGNTGVREIEDVGGEAANAAEMKAASSGNPLILEEMTLRQRIRSLESERTAFARDQHRVRDRIQMEKDNIGRINRTLADLRQDATVPVPDKFAVEIGGQTFDKRAAAGEAILAVAAEMERGGVAQQDIGSYGGFNLSLYRLSSERYVLSLEGTGTYETKVEFGNDPVGLATRLTNSVRDLDVAMERMEAAKATAEKSVPALESQVRSWGKESDLADLTKRHADVIEQLRPKKKEAPTADPSVAETATSPAEPKYNDLPEDGTEFAANVAVDLAAYDELFRSPRATGQNTLTEVFAAIDPDVKVIGDTARVDEREESGADNRILLRTPEGRDFYVYQNADQVWFDVSRVEQGEGGSRLYQALAEYALNTDRVFIGDPVELSDIALRRRTDAMLSSALKHGTTSHLAPHPRQITGDKALGVPGLDWQEGNFFANIQSLINVSVSALAHHVPEIRNARYDFKTRTFRTGNGKPISDGLFASWASADGVRAASAGSTSLKRAILLNSLAHTESGARPGLLEQIYRLLPVRGLDAPLHATFYDWTKDSTYSRLPGGNRIQLASRLRKLEKLKADGKITPDAYSDEIANIADWLEKRTEESATKRTFAERERGVDMVLERLHRARRTEQISEHAADIAIWALNKNPHLADDLAISVSTKGTSLYDRSERMIRLMTEGMRDTAPIHEILHHTERMMPPEVQNGIAKAYNAAWKEAYATASPEVRDALDALRLSMWNNKKAMEQTQKNFRNGLLQYHKHYQLASASEFWAVNAANIMADRFVASQGGWVKAAKQWLKEFVQKIRGIMGMSSDAPVIRGLSAVLNGNGSFASTRMLGSNALADRPNDYAEAPRYHSDLTPTTVPTPEEDDKRVRRWWDSFKTLSSDVTTNAMQKGLAVVPMRPLVLELGRNMAAAADYMRLKQSMDAMRSSWHAKTDAVAQRWLKYRVANRAENDVLMDLMHESTRQQVDPSEIFAPLMTDKDTAALRTAIPGSTREEELLKKAAIDTKRRAAYQERKKVWDTLSPEAQAIYREVRNTYSNLADAYEDVLMQNMEKAINVRIKKAAREHKHEMERIRDEGLQGRERDDAVMEADRRLRAAKTKIAWNRKARITQLRQQFETERLGGPYFPLARFGNLFVTVRDVKDGKVLSFSRFESARDQRRFAEEMRANKDYTVEIGALDDTAATRKAVDPNFVADVEDILADLPNAEKVKDEVWQRYLESLPDMSVRKNRIHRLGRDGFNADALRAFGSHMFHGSHQLARLAHSFDMEEAVNEAREQARETKDPVRSALVVNELAKRHDFVMNPTGGPIAQVVTQAAFIWALAGSPKAAIVNLFQTTVMGVPILAAYDGSRLNSFARAGLQLNRALVDFTRGIGFAERSGGLSLDERKAMQAGYKIGIIDRTQSHDLAGIGETGVEYSPAKTRIMAWLAWGFHHTERLNREVTFLAAYRMARDKGLGHNAAIDKAGDLTWKTHFDYQNTSRPRVMHSDLMKAALVFRNFQVNMLWRLFRDTHQAVAGESKAVRKEALTQLAGVTGMMMLNAGITGTWLFGIATMMAGLFMESGDDPEVELKKAMVNAVGPMMAGIILDGVPGYITGTSLSESVGMPDLWFRSPDRTLEGKDEFQYWQSQLLGAAPSLLENVVRGYSMATQGEVYRGIETMMPKFIKDPMKAYRYATDGAKNLRGDTVTDIYTEDWIKQAFGFTPARVSEQYAINTANYNKQQAIMKDRKRLLDDYYKAEERDDDAALDKIDLRIDAFNEKYPEQEITGKTISSSRKTRDRNREDATGGMRYNSKLRDRILDEQAPTIY